MKFVKIGDQYISLEHVVSAYVKGCRDCSRDPVYYRIIFQTTNGSSFDDDKKYKLDMEAEDELRKILGLRDLFQD